MQRPLAYLWRPQAMKPNPSQYHGTLKNSICRRCGKDLNSMNAYQQEIHARDCNLQKKLFEEFKK